jgi:hypothetical protein
LPHAAATQFPEHPSPLALFRLGRMLTSPPAPQGIHREQAQPVSLETDITPLGFSTSLALSILWRPATLGYGFPSEAALCHHRPCPHLRVAVRPLPELIETTMSVTARRDSRRSSRLPLRRLSAAKAGHAPSPKRTYSPGVGLPLRVFKNNDGVAPIGLARSPFAVLR